MIKVLADGKEFQVEEGTRIVDFINSNGISHETPILGAILNNVEVTLRHKLEEDCTIKFIDYTDAEGEDIYRRSLLFLFSPFSPAMSHAHTVCGCCTDNSLCLEHTPFRITAISLSLSLSLSCCFAHLLSFDWFIYFFPMKNLQVGLTIVS